MSRIRLLAAVLSALSAAGVLAVWALLVGTWTGQLLDSRALDGSVIGAWRVSAHARALLHVVSMPAVVVLVLTVLALALLRGVRRQALWACVTVVGTNVSTQVLKQVVLPRPDWGFSERWDAANTLPSGHTAVAASAAVALVLVAPARWRPAAAWSGAALTALMGLSTLVCQWHRPSDVVAAVLVALAWGLAAVAGGALTGNRPGGDDPTTLPDDGGATVAGRATVEGGATVAGRTTVEGGATVAGRTGPAVSAVRRGRGGRVSRDRGPGQVPDGRDAGTAVGPASVPRLAVGHRQPWAGLRLLAALGLLAATGAVLTGTAAVAGVASTGRAELLACYATGAGATLAVCAAGLAVLAACATASSDDARTRPTEGHLAGV